MKKSFIIIILLVILAGLFNYRIKIKNLWLDITAPAMPAAVEYQLVEIKEEVDKSLKTALPKTYNLNVPFTPQAPLADWNETFKEGCEEASSLIVHYFYNNKAFTPQLATDEILAMVDWQLDYFGGHYDLTAKQTKEMINKYFGYAKVEVIDNPTIEDIKKHIFNQRPVIVPVAGRKLNNPYFKQPGPIYHMLVIKGYTEDKFITNEPGTKRGKDFLYSYDTIMAAMHDWNGENIDKGAKKIIIIYK